MRTIAGGLLVLALVLASALTAAAQPGMTPAGYAPAPVVAPRAEPKMRVDLAIGMASAKGDWMMDGGLGVKSSPTFALQLGLVVGPGISLFGGLRHTKVKVDEESQLGELDLSHRELQLGLRVTTAMSSTSRMFFEGSVMSGRLAFELDGESESRSGLGFGIRGGLLFAVDSKISLGAAVGYSTTELGDDNEEQFVDAWLTGDLFVSLGF